ncbi:MAG: hypothetical protein CMG71_00405 [Candidatus Marinimicrobia bacterium]|nr:hypothetical protein [Candidatus Neomarinimicrobiota bacterium]|tara:strand:- start:6182 stop:7327 length:1146 start_codon:yes stop_codon:yes gene_type:complete
MKRKIFITGTVCIIMVNCSPRKQDGQSLLGSLPEVLPPVLDVTRAEELVQLSLDCVDRKFPYKIGYRFDGPEWIKPHYEVTPSFYGCWDWHSAVHGHWTMTKILKMYPDISVADSIRAKLSTNLSRQRLDAEFRFFTDNDFTKGFERTYGWAWLMKLYSELSTWDDKEGQAWARNMRPLAELLSRKTVDYLNVLSSPLRPGTHANTAFSFSLMYDYAVTVEDTALFNSIKQFSNRYFAPDRDCPTAYEPSGTDFLSPCLAEAESMSKTMGSDEFPDWLDMFLPAPADDRFHPLRSPPVVLDLKDPGIGHLIGLMFHRAWTMNQLASVLPSFDERREIFSRLAAIHAREGYTIMFDSGYGGEHWLATFAVYTMSEYSRLNSD